jgi:CspA family cold shock protein
MATGTVKWFNAQKGFGFIQPDDGGQDVFLHISAVERSGIGNPAEGQKLSYELQRDPKKGRVSAANLKVV